MFITCTWDMCAHDHLLQLATLHVTTDDFGGLFPTMYYKYHTTTLLRDHYYYTIASSPLQHAEHDARCGNDAGVCSSAHLHAVAYLYAAAYLHALPHGNGNAGAYGYTTAY